MPLGHFKELLQGPTIVAQTNIKQLPRREKKLHFCRTIYIPHGAWLVSTASNLVYREKPTFLPNHLRSSRPHYRVSLRLLISYPSVSQYNVRHPAYTVVVSTPSDWREYVSLLLERAPTALWPNELTLIIITPSESQSIAVAAGVGTYVPSFFPSLHSQAGSPCCASP